MKAAGKLKEIVERDQAFELLKYYPISSYILLSHWVNSCEGMFHYERLKTSHDSSPSEEPLRASLEFPLFSE